METRLIKDSTEFASLEPFWNQLVVEIVANTCHSTFEWLFTWWKHFGADKQLLLIAAYENGVPVGLAPLYVDTCAAGFRNLHFIGQGL